jgi:hypothetical protein
MDRQGSAHWSAYTSAYWDPADLCLQGGLNAVRGSIDREKNQCIGITRGQTQTGRGEHRSKFNGMGGSGGEVAEISGCGWRRGDIESTGQYDREPSRIPGVVVGSTRLGVHTAW